MHTNFVHKPTPPLNVCNSGLGTGVLLYSKTDVPAWWGGGVATVREITRHPWSTDVKEKKERPLFKDKAKAKATNNARWRMMARHILWCSHRHVEVIIIAQCL
jgi:hypothetical protein